MCYGDQRNIFFYLCADQTHNRWDLVASIYNFQKEVRRCMSEQNKKKTDNICFGNRDFFPYFSV